MEILASIATLRTLPNRAAYFGETLTPFVSLDGGAAMAVVNLNR